MPDLARASSEAYDLATLTAVLREHLRRGGNIVNLGRLLWLLLDLGNVPSGSDQLSLSEMPRRLRPGRAATRPESDSPRDPVVLASLVRKALTEEAWRIGRFRWPDRVARLSQSTEEALTAAEPDALASAEWAVLTEVDQLGWPDLLVVRRAAAVPPLNDCLRALAAPPRVLSADELPPDTNFADLTVAAPAAVLPPGGP